MMQSRLGRARLRGLFAMGTGVALLASQLAGGPASAQTKEELDKARAMFLEGVSLAAANNCAAALAKYQAVAKVKVTPQVAFNMAECEERLGKLVSALGSYRLAASMVVNGKPAEVAKPVGGRISSLEERIPRLVIERTEQTSHIELDGVELGSSQIGAENLVDPGTHTVSGKVGETEVWRESVQIGEKERKSVTVKIDVEKFKPPPRPTATETAPIETAAPTSTEVAAPPSKAPAFVIGGLGVASLAAGGALLGIGLGSVSALEKNCPTHQNCPASDKDKYNSARTLTGVGEALLGVGVAAVAVGVVVLVVRGSGSKPPAGAGSSSAAANQVKGPIISVSVRGGAGSAGLSVVGRF